VSAGWEIVPAAESYLAGYRRAVDIVARERKYLAFLEAWPIEQTRAFLRDNLSRGNPHFLVVRGDDVGGWCDIIRNLRPIHPHCGTLGIGLVPELRRQGIGRRLMQHTIAAAFACSMTRIELTVRENNSNAIALYKSLGFAIEGLHRNAVCIARGTKTNSQWRSCASSTVVSA